MILYLYGLIVVLIVGSAAAVTATLGPIGLLLFVAALGGIMTVAMPLDNASLID